MQNVRVELSIQDTVTAQVQTSRSATLLVLDGQSGQIRSNAPALAGSLNVDARPSVLKDGRILLGLTLEYSGGQTPGESGNAVLPVITESVTAVLVDAKPQVISISADPRTARQVTVTVTASVVN
jgi:hypothetical protein